MVAEQDDRSGVDTLRVRDAVAGDLPALVSLYNHYVEHTHFTFDTEPFTVEARRPWFARFAPRGPHRLLVAESAGRVVGYASSHDLRPKPAYDCSVETTIYLDPEHQGRGVGRRLYGELLAVLEAEPSLHRAYGGIALPNPDSVLLHERLGYRAVGRFHQVGFKFGRYWDIGWYERDLSGDVGRED